MNNPYYIGYSFIQTYVNFYKLLIFQ